MPNRKSKSSNCPVCGNVQTPDFRPFCSKGCRDRDLLKWLGEGYKVPGPPVHDMDEKSRKNEVDSDL
ncbi:DNA gyrase inhibitor YacG [Rhizorhapis sp. SPR117]|uniref:DNA gyrase inhibitor YacG n=1 Tax=Rhizorhapis sp. SPR117 TaxID=2912611 RepID=UPI001F161D97|nr:DNA gyrase inhibitor YacG [Rhizorhapis sp. SPR117]